MAWKESPADTIALCFYYLQNYYLRESYHGFCNLGTNQLLSKYSDLLQNPEDLNFPTETCSAEDIVDRVKESIHTFAKEHTSPEVVALHNADIDADPEQDPAHTAADPEKYLHSYMQQETPTKRQFETPTKRQFIKNNMSQSQRVINEKKIEFVPKKGTFLVEGTCGDQYAVTLFPESCQCPATNQCYHILTARKSIGMDISSKIKKCNLTVMMKRSKTSGRKKPRINDYNYQFSAAPDSEVGVGLSNTPKSPKLDNSFFSISSNTEINSCNHEYAQASTPVQK